ncbi:hypothetical protein CDAR_454551 [Caerostris darwini]|uniref:Uncharacterized protein n=1 Tax=Caerostris darwini TaxID=1538125 RepID=A0AAV4TXZ2_9ARAC|nr:hypothetical protein CDAR_454551 [Caerostris darwini]
MVANEKKTTFNEHSFLTKGLEERGRGRGWSAWVETFEREGWKSGARYNVSLIFSLAHLNVLIVIKSAANLLSSYSSYKPDDNDVIFDALENEPE